MSISSASWCPFGVLWIPGARAHLRTNTGAPAGQSLLLCSVLRRCRLHRWGVGRHSLLLRPGCVQLLPWGGLLGVFLPYPLKPGGACWEELGLATRGRAFYRVAALPLPTQQGKEQALGPPSTAIGVEVSRDTGCQPVVTRPENVCGYRAAGGRTRPCEYSLWGQSLRFLA